MKVKIRFDDEIHAIKLEYPTLLAIREHVVKVFPQLEQEFTLAYKDTVGDTITVSCQEELQVLVGEAQDQTINIIVVGPKAQQKKPQQEKEFPLQYFKEIIKGDAFKEIKEEVMMLAIEAFGYVKNDLKGGEMWKDPAFKEIKDKGITLAKKAIGFVKEEVKKAKKPKQEEPKEEGKEDTPDEPVEETPDHPLLEEEQPKEIVQDKKPEEEAQKENKEDNEKKIKDLAAIMNLTEELATEYVEKHKDKTLEEIVDLLYNQK